jgi:hypothetical protein
MGHSLRNTGLENALNTEIGMWLDMQNFSPFLYSGFGKAPTATHWSQK